MASKFVNVDRDTPLFMAPDLRDWVPANHIVHFIIDSLDAVPLHGAKTNVRGTGSEQYPPQLMLGLLIYSYITGRFSSREIEAATYSDVAMRFLTADLHPDHDTICVFRCNNKALIKSAMTSVLLLAREMKLLKLGSVSVDGSKVLANASKHKAVSYKRAGEIIEQLELEVGQLLARAEDAESKDLADGLSIPTEITRRKERIERLKEACAVIEAQARERAAEQQPEYEEKLAARERKKAEGKRRGGKPPQPPSATPAPGDQFNFTDPESAIMKAGNGKHFVQAFNAQAAVDADGSMLIVGARVSEQDSGARYFIKGGHRFRTMRREGDFGGGMERVSGEDRDPACSIPLWERGQSLGGAGSRRQKGASLTILVQARLHDRRGR